MKINKKFRSPNYYGAYRRSPWILVIHATAADTWNSTKWWFMNPKSRSSSHYVVDKNGDIYQMVDESYPAWHAGVSQFKGVDNINFHSIGIEIVNDSKKPYPEAQIKAVEELSRDIMKRHGIALDNVVRHSDISGFRGKRDPYKHFPWSDFKKNITPKKMENFDINKIIADWTKESPDVKAAVEWAESKQIIKSRNQLSLEQLKNVIMTYRSFNLLIEELKGFLK